MHVGHLVDKMDSISSIVLDVSVDSLKDKDFKQVQIYIDRLVRDKDIISIKVLDKAKHAVAVASVPVDYEEKSLPFFIPALNTYERPIVDEGEVLGTLTLIYSGKQLNEDLLDLLLLPPIAQSIVFILLVLSIFTFIYRKVGKPILILKEHMSSVASGDLSVKIQDLDSSEINHIAEGLRFLISGMSSNVQRFQQVLVGITDTLNTLNSTFNAATDRVKNQSMSTNLIAGTMKMADKSQGSIKDGTGMLKELIEDNLASVLEIKANEEEMLKTMESLFDVVDSSYAVVEEMTHTSKLVMENSDQVLHSVENTSASVEEIIASVREVDRSARESSQIAENVRQLAAQKGIVTVDRAITGMGKISEKVTFAVSIVKKLDKRSKEAQKILLIINEITEQTNLLSINASILAEQAGEYGKGFTVVAEQMRSLSNKTGGYTQEIAGIIKQIQVDVNDVVHAIQEGNDLVKEGNDSVYEVGDTMSSILELSHSSANMTKMIEKATDDQVLALRHVESSVIDVNTRSLQMSEAMKEMFKSSSYLYERISEVKDVTEITRSGSTELAKGISHIYDNLERSSQSVTDIDSAISTQTEQGQDILAGVEAIRNEGVWIISDLDELANAIEGLGGEFSSLKADISKYRVK